MIKKYSFPLLSIFVGIMVGFATIVGQKFFPGALNSLANSGSIWMIPAFYIAKSYRQKWKSILSSIFCLLVCVEVYYGYYSIVWNTGFSIGFHQAIWLCCAVIFGFLFGLGANLSQYGNGKIQYLCKIMLPAAFLAEGLMLLSHLQHYLHMVSVIFMWLFIGALLYFLICKKEWNSKQYSISLLIMTGLGFLGYQTIYYLSQYYYISNPHLDKVGAYIFIDLAHFVD